MAGKKIVKLKLDIIFKRIFGDPRNERFTRGLLADMLEIPRESIRHIEYLNTELPVNNADDKNSRVDIRLDVDGKIVDVEMQTVMYASYGERSLYYWARIFGSQLKTGFDYSKLKDTLCINILGYNAFECADYHSRFNVLEVNRHEKLSDKLDIHFFELKKLKGAENNKPVEDWLRLINAETEDELMSIMEETTVPEIKDVVVTVNNMSTDEAVQHEALNREMFLHDMATLIAEGEARGKAEGKAEGKTEIIISAYKNGKTASEIADFNNIDIKYVEEVIRRNGG